jgi:hypothetical protein
MATARKNASKAEQLRVSQIGDFKSRMGGVMELPSGLVMKLKNPGGLQSFIANGTIPNSLLGIVQEGLKGKSGLEATKAAADMADNLDSLGDMLKMLDLVMIQAAKEPRVFPVPTPEDLERHNILNRDKPENQFETIDDLRESFDDDRLYVDEIEEMDKQFVFQWVSGGVRDLETFRAQLQSNVDAVSAVQGSAGSAEPADGSDAG